MRDMQIDDSRDMPACALCAVFSVLLLGAMFAVDESPTKYNGIQRSAQPGD